MQSFIYRNKGVGCVLELDHALISRLASGRRTIAPIIQYLKKHFILLDHAELAARAFFDRIQPLLQIAHLGIERGVARLQLQIGIALRSELPIDLPYPQPAALAQPLRILQQRDQAGEGEREEPHAVSRYSPRN